MASNARPDFRQALRASTATARSAAVKTIEGSAEDKAHLFDKADQVMAGGGLVGGKAGTVPDTTVRSEQHLPVGPTADEEIIINAPIAKVHDNDWNARAWYDPKIIKQRAAEIATDGQKTPALAVPHPTIPGEWMLIEGHYRKRAILALNKPTIKVTLRRDWTTPEQRFVQSWKANEERLANSPLDNAVQWSRVLEEKVVPSRDKLADLLGISPAAVTKALALNGLPAAAMQKAREKPAVFSASTLYELRLIGKHSGEPELLMLMDRVEQEGWSRRQLEVHREQTANPRSRKPKEISRQYKILIDSVQVGTLKENDSGMVRLEIKIDDAGERQKLVAELKFRFGLDPDAQLTLK